MRRNSIWLMLVSLIAMGLIGACYSPPESFDSVDSVDTALDSIEYDFVEIESSWCGNGCGNGGCENGGCENGGCENGGCENGGCENGGCENGGCGNGGCGNGGCENGGCENGGCENGGGHGSDPAVKLCFQGAKECRQACMAEVIPPEIAEMLEQCNVDLKACIEENPHNKRVCRREFRKCRHEAMKSVELTEEQKIQLHECKKVCFEQLEACLEAI